MVEIIKVNIKPNYILIIMSQRNSIVVEDDELLSGILESFISPRVHFGEERYKQIETKRILGQRGRIKKYAHNKKYTEEYLAAEVARFEAWSEKMDRWIEADLDTMTEEMNRIREADYE